MYRFLVRPKWIMLHLLCIGGIVAMVSLGFWQLRRLEQRTTFNDRVEQNGAAPITDLTDVVPPDARLGDPTLEALTYRTVRVQGTYEPGRDLLMVSVSQGGQNGRNMVNALRLDDGTLVVVNRGFVPSGLPVAPTPTGSVEVIGRLRETQTAGLGQITDDGSVQLVEIRRVDLAVLSTQFDDPIVPMYIEALESTPAEPDQVQAVVAPALGNGPHLSYAVQWFFFSACVVLGWGVAVRRQVLEASGKPPKRRRPPPIADPGPQF